MPHDRTASRPVAKDASLDWPFLPARSPTIVGGKGAWLFCEDGSKILDAAGGAIVANIGHGRREPVEAAAKAGDVYVVPTWRTPEREALAARLRASWLPEGLHHIHLASGGSEGVEAAVKIAVQSQAARGMSERVKVMAREVSYHGTTIAMAGLSGHVSRKRGMEGFLAEFPRIPTPWPLRAAPGEDHAAACLAASRAAIEAEGPRTIAAIVSEPITGSSGGAIVPPDGYLPGLRALCDEYGILLIIDEVMTGFGRCGSRFACEHFGVRPDILVSGKGLAGGYAAICGVFTTPEVAEPIAKAGLQVMFHTFAALPSACAAANEVLRILEEENLLARAAKMGARLRAVLDERLGQHPHVAEIRGLGLLQAVEIVRDREKLERFDERDKVTNRIVGKGLERGVFYYPGGTGEVRDIVCLGPPFIVSEEEIDLMADVLARSIDEVLC
ncbi:MAG: aspartate aminotransferase family protein [Caulobacteraceae bacterium]